MTRRFEDARILMYSHDTFGLGHLRRCRTIAHSLVEDFRGLNILIVSGAQIAGAFDYRARVDFVKIPSVIKLRNGEYTSLERHIDLQDTLKMRQSIIRHTAETFQPDIFIVDKEPMGLRGEIEDTLSYLKTRGTTLILGPARGDGFAGTARRGMEAPRRDAQDRPVLRHDLGLRPAGILRSADRARRSARRARQDEVRRLPAAQSFQRPGPGPSSRGRLHSGHDRRRRRRR